MAALWQGKGFPARQSNMECSPLEKYPVSLYHWVTFIILDKMLYIEPCSEEHNWFRVSFLLVYLKSFFAEHSAHLQCLAKVFGPLELQN